MNKVNFSTGVSRDQASVSSTLYSNITQRLAIYEVDKLLTPKAVFPVTPFLDVAAPAPTPGSSPALKRRKKKEDDDEGVAPVADGGRSGSGRGGPRSARASTSGGGGGGGRSLLHYSYCVVFVFWLMVIR